MFGIKDHLIKNTIKASTYGCKETKKHRLALGYSNIVVPFWIVAGGSTIALLFIIAELMVYKVNYLEQNSPT